ncbi:MAG: hypothetical protein QOC81_4322 [Thermoanaerobaculia bacterium]|jgi:hypothetical protein|nr:hypothetical protein [Thermoanaerobaculia bacterium]
MRRGVITIAILSVLAVLAGRWNALASKRTRHPSGQYPVIALNMVRMRIGDDPSWATPSYDDRRWRSIEVNDVPNVPDIVWLRTPVDLSHIARPPTHPLGLAFSGMAAHEIFWDGIQIGKGGTPARTAAGEEPGPVDSLYQVPDALATRGVHSVAMRLSAFHRHFAPVTGVWGVFVGDYAAIEGAAARRMWIAIGCLSGLLLTSVFAAAMYFLNDRDRGSLLLATLCLSAAALLIAESWRSLFGYTYNLHLVRLVSVTILTWLVSVQLVALACVRFPHRFARPVMMLTVVTTALCALLPMWDLKAGAMLVIGVFVAWIWTIAASRRNAAGSNLALIGVSAVAVGLVYDPTRFAESGLFFLLNVLFVCLLCSHVLDVRRDRDARSEVELKSARLELELLKRQLQPHFLMNTLTALSEWVERDPAVAVSMIGAIADEMRILTDVASESTIHIDDELRLCRAHLAMMTMRKDVRYELVTSGFAGNELVPPGIFHTLVENAVTHAPRGADIAISLDARTDAGLVRYSFASPSARDAGLDDGPVTTGTGTRYIEARLREAWGERWTFSQRRDGLRWIAEITVPAAVPA